MSEQKIDKTFHGAYSEIERLTKVFRKGGLLEKAIMEVGGDPAYMDDVRSAMDAAYDALDEAHYGALAHLEMGESVNEAAAKIACVECDEVSTAAAWKKNNGFCPKCKTSSQGVAESTAVTSKKLTEGVLDSDDDDGFMARSQLYFLAKDAITLHGIIGDRDNLEPWVQSKITTAAEGMDAVRRYTEYQALKAQSQLPVPVEQPVAVEPEMEESDSVVESKMSDMMIAASEMSKEEFAKAYPNFAKDYEKLRKQQMTESKMADMMIAASEMSKEEFAKAYPNFAKDYEKLRKQQMTESEKRWKQTSLSPAEAEAEYGKENVKVKKGALRNGDDMVEVLVDESVTEGKKKQIDRNGDGKNDWEDVKLARKAAAAKAQQEPVDEDLKVVAQDMFKSALSAAKKRAQ